MSKVFVLAVEPIITTIFDSIGVESFLWVWIHDFFEILWLEVVAGVLSPEFAGRTLLFFKTMLFWGGKIKVAFF